MTTRPRRSRRGLVAFRRTGPDPATPRGMPINPRAGTLPDQSMLVDVPLLVSEYYTRTPEPSQRAERVAFGTSGHRGSSLNGAFNERHILAITQAIVEFRRGQGIDGPLFIRIDTHA